ncbi:TetR family transcriptional regulator [Herbiconiux sp. P18]|uniref:TetR family transcriptional regulator n=1 Tax=Herbiconiux liangxiaofengii TaxID=3342795 RepID=UPI0035BA7A00
MPQTPPPVPMRERTRRLAQTELTRVAQDLFLENGYEETTIDQIAAAAGMSRRTFFRYFASKDDLVIGKYELFGQRMADTLRGRPADEPLWHSLRRVFDIALVYFDDSPERARNEAMEKIVRSSPTLYAGYLEKLSRMQSLVTEAAIDRMPASHPDGLTALRASSIVGAAFACVMAAQSAWLASAGSRPAAELLDLAMHEVEALADPT